MKNIYSINPAIYFFFLIILCQANINPAYNGYLFVFFAFLYANSRKVIKSMEDAVNKNSAPIFLFWIIFETAYTFFFDNLARDVFRDYGVLLAFVVGFFVIAEHKNSDAFLNLMDSMSIGGIFVSAYTIYGAISAYLAGADAYRWRGEYVPLSHGWLPYFMVINYYLMMYSENYVNKYLYRMIFCLVATILSLSRTDILLDFLFLFIQFFLNINSILRNVKNYPKLLVLFLVSGVFFSYILQLDVVRERIDTGVGDEDQSVGWRIMENENFNDVFWGSNFYEILFGYGFGARIGLPSGIVDFDGNPSIPLMHNSFYTLLLKFGVVGMLLFVLFSIKSYAKFFEKSNKLDDTSFYIGFWISFFIFGKAITLQGLTEWSHVIFFGLAMACLNLKMLSNK